MDATFVGRVLSVTQRNLSWPSVVDGGGGRAGRLRHRAGCSTSRTWQEPQGRTRADISGRFGFIAAAPGEPEFEFTSEDEEGIRAAARIMPVYRLTSGVSQRYLRGLIARMLESYAALVPETLPSSLIGPKTPSRMAALRGMHFPDDEQEFGAALARMKLEELFYMQLALSPRGATMAKAGALPRGLRVRARAPLSRRAAISLTGAQQKVLSREFMTLMHDRSMNRLLQGDVGSGQDPGGRRHAARRRRGGIPGVMMVPTEILSPGNTSAPWCRTWSASACACRSSSDRSKPTDKRGARGSS